MIIGIPKETKKGEARVSLIPVDVKKLVKLGHGVFVEHNAGFRAGFSNKEYLAAGSKIKKKVYNCPMIVRVKVPPLNSIKKNQIIMAYLHIEKGQDIPLLKKLLQKKVKSYAYEEIRDDKGKRLVTLGFEAGVVGMYEGLRIYGKMLNNEFKKLPPIEKCITMTKVFKELSKLNLKTKPHIVIMGCGRVSKGCQKVLKHASIKPEVLYRDKTPYIKDYLPTTDILVNAVVWLPIEPRIVTKDMLSLMKKTSLIDDISCDEKGAVETCKPRSWGQPTYKVKGITHYCIDNLPTALPRAVSISLSRMILPYAIAVANGKDLKQGLMTKEGKIKFKLPKGNEKLIKKS